MKGLSAILITSLIAWFIVTTLAADRLPKHERPGYAPEVSP